MPDNETANREQAELWNNASGPAWVEMQETLDRMMQPFADRLVAGAAPGKGGRVLDIGCGAGATTLAMAHAVGPAGSCVGVDISAPLVAAAAARARKDGLSWASFVEADAQTHAFAPQRFDAIISRFGVMFFEDPVAAFRNIRSAAAADGRLSFIAWRSPLENPFMMAAARAVAHLVPPMTPPAPNAPGQFGFADDAYVRRVLSESAWRDIAIDPLDEVCTVSTGDLMDYATKLGPAGAALRVADAATRATAAESLRTAFAPFVEGDAARFTAACWWVTAKA